MSKEHVRKLVEKPPLLDESGVDIRTIPTAELTERQRLLFRGAKPTTEPPAISPSQKPGTERGRRDSLLKYSRDVGDHQWLRRIEERLKEEGATKTEIHQAKTYFVNARRKSGGNRQESYNLSLDRFRRANE